MNVTLIDDLWWGCDLQLTEWAGFQSRRGPYASIDSVMPSSGYVPIVFAPEGRGTDPLTKSELAMLDWFEDHHTRVSRAAVSAILDWCSPAARHRREEFGWGDGFPVISSADDLKSQIGVYKIYIHNLSDQNIPYIGFEMGCNWEEEHGLGVLMHGTRCAEVGHADSAFTLWRVTKDIERST
jgi:hypothetical protein